MYIILLIIIIIILYYQQKFIDIPKPHFLSANETSIFLQNDRDKFVNSLNEINLLARNSKTSSEYISYIIKNTLNFTENQKNIIIKCFYKSYKIMFANLKKIENYGIYKDKLSELFFLKNIRFALTKKKAYEYGMPHTRNNIIFLSSFYLDKYIDNPLKISKTIIHEIIHIYQRIYRNSYNTHLVTKGWVLTNTINSKKRMNPDLDNLIWKRKDKLYFVKFKKNPKNLEDIITVDSSSRNEHPYEYYAYKISNLIISFVF
jgi:hypothetical protein